MSEVILEKKTDPVSFLALAAAKQLQKKRVSKS